MATEEPSPPIPPQHAPQLDDEESTTASLEKDLATTLVGQHATPIDPDLERRVVRRIDWFLMPAMIVGASLIPSLSNKTTTPVLI
jgi:hypothetical protein